MKRSSSAAALLLFGALALTGCASWYVHPLPTEAHEFRARTRDGWELAMVQYVPKGVPTGRPVLLCHGISANGRHMDLDEAHSLARFFAEHGREAWTMSLRGTGQSDRIDPAKHRPGGYSFDTLWNEDTRAAIEFVRTHAQTPKLIADARHDGETLTAEQLEIEHEPMPTIDYVGHSMGGMLVYAYLSQGGPGLHAVVTMGSPTRLDWGGIAEPLLVGPSEQFLSKDGAIPMEGLALFSMIWQGRTSGDPLERLLMNPDNIKPATWQRMVAIGTGDISNSVWLQLERMTTSGRFESFDGKINYREDMSRIHVPVLVVAGKLDRIAVAPAVKDGYRALGGPKEWFLAAEESGFHADYGHMDMVVGERASKELWPKLIDFLDRQRAQ